MPTWTLDAAAKSITLEENYIPEENIDFDDNSHSKEEYNIDLFVNV